MLAKFWCFFFPLLPTCIFLSSYELLFSQFSVFMKDSKINKWIKISQFRKLSTDEIRESPTCGEAGSKEVLKVLIKTHSLTGCKNASWTFLFPSLLRQKVVSDVVKMKILNKIYFKSFVIPQLFFYISVW